MRDRRIRVETKYGGEKVYYPQTLQRGRLFFWRKYWGTVQIRRMGIDEVFYVDASFKTMNEARECLEELDHKPVIEYVDLGDKE